MSPTVASGDNGLPTGMVQEMTAELPGCATRCLTNELPNYTCQPAEPSCICTNQKLNAAIELCVSSNCTVIESLKARKYHSLTCGEPARRNHTQAPILWSLFTATLMAVVARFAAKLFALNPVFNISWDDWCIFASLL
nr:CFEM domain-containing protein [Colletotrichum truncatum]KAF6783787.1 CFEM domain-containing protein [Colletotrichum truncatum]